MTTALPRDMHLLRDDLRSCCNALDLLERALIAGEWKLTTDAERVGVAYRKIERDCIAAVDRIGVRPKERMALVDQITALQAENANQRETISRLTAASAVGGRHE